MNNAEIGTRIYGDCIELDEARRMRENLEKVFEIL
jgi:hypothetical protein